MAPSPELDLYGHPKYEWLKRLGTGTFGAVGLCRVVDTDEMVAVKCLELDMVDKNTEREVMNHRKLRHAHIIEFKRNVQGSGRILGAEFMCLPHRRSSSRNTTSASPWNTPTTTTCSTTSSDGYASSCVALHDRALEVLHEHADHCALPKHCRTVQAMSHVVHCPSGLVTERCLRICRPTTTKPCPTRHVSYMLHWLPPFPTQAMLQEPLARWFFQQLIMALDYCHSKGVVNRDMKLENTLLQAMSNKVLLVKVCDFGYSKAVDQSLPKSKVGTSSCEC
eukprot:330594-Chlamydomonas_euryale.AAC.10